MMLADLDGNLLFYVIAAVIGLISWLTKKDEKKPGEHTPSPKFPRPKPVAQKPEEDRLRDFLDALGIPADQRPPVAQGKPTARVNRPAVAEDLRGSASPAARTTVAPAPRPVPTPRAAPPPMPHQVAPVERRIVPPLPVAKPEREWAALDEQEAPSLSVENLHFQDLVTRAMPEFVTTSSSVSAIPSDQLPAMPRDRDAYNRDPALAAEHARKRVATLLQNPQDVRAAIILREILGAAPGLQRPGSLPTFP